MPNIPAVQLRGLTKRFGSVTANEDISLEAQIGSIVGIVGENGAGKSTAMKLLFGLLRPDAGEILIDGEPRTWRSPREAMAAGLGMVHQHFMLAGPCSALDNILLESRQWGRLNRGQARGRLEVLAEQYGLPVEWNRPVDELPVGIQQRVEILKLVYRDSRILILDEPTAVLTPQETAGLFANLRKLKEQGRTILLVTHKLKEVLALTDRVVVFRSGRVIGARETAQTNAQELAEMIIGRKVTFDAAVPGGQPKAELALALRNVSLKDGGGRNRLTDVNLTVHAGEIVGIAGVEGNGQSELVQSLLHPAEPRCRTSGEVEIAGHNVTTWPSGAIRKLAVGLIPEDRLRDGLLPQSPLLDNFLLGAQRAARFQRAGLLKPSAIAGSAAHLLEQYDIRPRDPALAAENLSGGNQQKLIAARELGRGPRLVVASQPTRGVDIGASQFIHQRLLEARDNGAGVLLISSELEEVLSLSDRILVMFEGRIVAAFKRGEISERELGLKMGGA